MTALGFVGEYRSALTRWRSVAFSIDSTVKPIVLSAAIIFFVEVPFLFVLHNFVICFVDFLLLKIFNVCWIDAGPQLTPSCCKIVFICDLPMICIL